MNFDLTSVEAKFRRAQEHANSVRNEVRAWFDTNPYHAIKNTNSDCTTHRLVLAIDTEPLLERWTLTIGDSLQNFRSSLDHLVYSIGLSQGLNLDGPRFSFPICDGAKEFRNTRRPLRDAGFCSRALTAIKGFQPYSRPHPDLPPILSILRDLNNWDKHRLVHLAFSTVSSGRFGIGGNLPVDSKNFGFYINVGELKHGAEIATIVFDRPSPEMKFDQFDIRLIIAVWHGKKNASGHASTARTDFSVILTLIEEEIRSIIDGVVAAIR